VRGDYQAAIDFLPITTFFSTWGGAPAHKLPALVRKFDMTFGIEENLKGWEPLPAPPKDVRTILCSPQAPGRLLEWAKGHLDHSHNNRTVVFSGTESPLSETWGWLDKKNWKNMTEQYKKYFKHIYYYVTDVVVEGVSTLPLGFTEMYMRGRTDGLLDAWVQTSTSDTWKVHSILAAWGLYAAGSDQHFVRRDNPPGAWGTLTGPWVEVANHAIDIRNHAAEWIDTPEGKATGVERRTIERDQWWMELSKYKFIIVPLGTAIQCAKVVEALSMLTIPIIKRGPFRTHDDLQRMGFPIVLVDAWVDITPESMKEWWRYLSPMLLAFREHCLNTEGFWRLLTQGKCAPYDSERLFKNLAKPVKAQEGDSPTWVRFPREGDSNLTGPDTVAVRTAT
jgi:hypothetical protein